MRDSGTLSPEVEVDVDHLWTRRVRRGSKTSEMIRSDPQRYPRILLANQITLEANPKSLGKIILASKQ
jgi:hypothetical protein